VGVISIDTGEMDAWEKEKGEERMINESQKENVTVG
jgi:hypothetical protein